MLMTSTMLEFEMLGSNIGSAISADKLMTAYFIRMGSGQRPTKEQIQAFRQLSGSDSYYVMTNLETLTNSLGKNVINLVQQNVTLPVYLDHDKISLKFTQITDQSASLQNDPPTWGLIGLFPRSTGSGASLWGTRMLLYFTVGDENSDADVKIKGGFIPQGTNWKINDFEISLTGGIK